MKTQGQLLAQAQQQVELEKMKDAIKSGKNAELQQKAFSDAFPLPSNYGDPIVKCEYDNPGYICAYNSQNQVNAFLPREVCNPQIGLPYVKKDRSMWYKINTRWFVPLYVALPLGAIISLLWWFVNPALGAWIFLFSFLLALVIGYGTLFTYWWRGNVAFGESPFKVRDEFECMQEKNVRKYTDIAARFDPPSNIATPLNAQGKIASTDINDQISLFDMKVVGSAKGNLLGYYNYGLLSPATGQNMKTSIDRIGTGLRSLRWFVAGNVLESISSGGQSNTGQIATQVAQAQIMANKLKTLDQHWKLIKDYQNPENNLLNDEKQMQKEFSMN